MYSGRYQVQSTSTANSRRRSVLFYFWSLLHCWANLDGMHRHTYLIGISCTFSSKSLLLLLASERERDRQMEIRILHFNFNFILSICNHDRCKINFSRSKNSLDSNTMTTQNVVFKKLEILPIPSLHDFFSIQFVQQRKLHHCPERSTSMGCLAENRIEP